MSQDRLDVINEIELREALPVGLRKTLNSATLSRLNGLLVDPVLQENFKNNLVSFTSVLESGSYKLQDYFRAVTYVSYILLGDEKKVAYGKTFPHRIEKFAKEFKSDIQISKYVWAYNNTKLVTDMIAQSMMPIHVVNYQHLQAAINKQVALMSCGNLTVEQKAATALMEHLKQPETTKIELDVSVTGNTMMTDLLKVTKDLVNQQRAALENRITTPKELAEGRIIEAEFTESSDG